jgi:hypothetical protein
MFTKYNSSFWRQHTVNQSFSVCFTQFSSILQPCHSTYIHGNLLFANNGLLVLSIPHLRYTCMSTQVRPSGESLTNYVSLLSVEVGQPCRRADFVVPLPGCGRSVTDFWGWAAHRAQLLCPDDVSDDDMYERGVPGGALSLNSTDCPDHGRYGDLPLQGKILTAEPGIEPGTSWLVVRSSDHQATRLVRCQSNFGW